MQPKTTAERPPRWRWLRPAGGAIAAAVLFAVPVFAFSLADLTVFAQLPADDPAALAVDSFGTTTGAGKDTSRVKEDSVLLLTGWEYTAKKDKDKDKDKAKKPKTTK